MLAVLLVWVVHALCPESPKLEHEEQLKQLIKSKTELKEKCVLSFYSSTDDKHDSKHDFKIQKHNNTKSET